MLSCTKRYHCPHNKWLTIIANYFSFDFLCISWVTHNLYHNIRINNFTLHVLVCFGDMLSTDNGQLQLCCGPANKTDTWWLSKASQDHCNVCGSARLWCCILLLRDVSKEHTASIFRALMKITQHHNTEDQNVQTQTKFTARQNKEKKTQMQAITGISASRCFIVTDSECMNESMEWIKGQTHSIRLCYLHIWHAANSQTGRTLNAPQSKAHSEQNTSASDTSTHTAPITKCASLLTRRNQSHHKDQSVLGCDVVSPLGKSFSTFQKHYGPSKHQRHSPNNKHHVQQHCCDNLPSPSFHPCRI